MKRVTSNQPTPPNRQRGGLGLWTLALLVLVGAAIGAVMAGIWVFNNVKAQLVATHTPALVTVPESFKVTATILNQLDIVIDDKVHTRVPVHKTLSVPINEPLHLRVKFDAYVPVSLNVEVSKTITIDQKMAIDTILQADLLGDTFPLPIQGKFPVKAKVPLNIVIPVHQMVHLQFTAPIQATLKENVQVPLDTVIEADVPLKTRMSVPINTPIKAKVQIQNQPLPVEIIYADLAIQLDNLRLGLENDAGNEKSAADNPRETQP